MTNYHGAILESFYMIDIPTDPAELASLLDNYALDWGIVLGFLDTVAIKRGIVLDKEKVCEIMKSKYGEF